MRFRGLMALCWLAWMPVVQAAHAAAVNAPAVDSVVKTATVAARRAYLSHSYDLAAQRYQEAISHGSSLSPRLKIVLWSNLGAAYREGHKQQQAEQAFKQAIAIAEQAHIESDPVATTAMRQYAVLLRKIGRAVDADLMEVRAAGTTAAAPNAGTDAGKQPLSGASLSNKLDASLDETVKKVRVDVDKLSIDEMKEIAQKSDKPLIWYLLARKYQSAKQLDNAVSTYRIIERRFPDDFKKIRPSFASCLKESGQLQDAISELRQAMNDDPQNAEIYLSMHDYLIDSGDIKGAIQNDEEFVDKFPAHPKYSLVNNVLKILKEQNDPNNARTANKPAPYEVSRALVWMRVLPLKVWVQGDSEFKFAPSRSGMTESTPEEVIQKACDMWVQASEGRVRFTQAPSADDANIEIAFTPDANSMESEGAAGVTHFPPAGEVMKARISLLTSNSSGRQYSREQFLETCLHELGHALGLEHSPKISDVMYPSHRDVPMTELSQNDAARIIYLYTIH